MDIEEYRKQFIDEIRFEAEHEGTDPESMFIEKVLEKLEEIGELSDSIPMSIEIRGYRNRLMAFDAYGYDEADGALVLIACDFTNRRDVASQLTNARIDELYTHMLNFIDEAVNGNISRYCDEADDAIFIAREFKKKIGLSRMKTEIQRFRFLIISNATLSKQVKNISQPNFLGRPVDLNVWTIESFYQYFASNPSETVDFYTEDFGCKGIQSMKANVGKNRGATYLSVVPGNFLANLYLVHGTRLLRNCVRAYSRNRVLQDILKSATNCPNEFFDLNNGIIAVAQDVQTDRSNNIVALKDFRIVDGVQTIITLALAKYKHAATNDLNGLFVPMKLVVLKDQDELKQQTSDNNVFCPTIVLSSHNQVPTRDADSCHPFHLKMEELSKKVLAPQVNGNPFQTRWYYERFRGGWNQEQLFMTATQIRKFGFLCPKSQVISKDKFAKCYNAILMAPHKSCKGYARFSETINDIYENKFDDVNEEFFMKGVGSVIIYDSIAKFIRQSQWGKHNNYNTPIIVYTISKLKQSLPLSNDIDWKLIWKKQCLFPAIEDELQRLAYATYVFLKEKAGRRSMMETSKLQSTWDDYKAIPYELSENFFNTLITK